MSFNLEILKKLYKFDDNQSKTVTNPFVADGENSLFQQETANDTESLSEIQEENIFNISAKSDLKNSSDENTIFGQKTSNSKFDSIILHKDLPNNPSVNTTNITKTVTNKIDTDKLIGKIQKKTSKENEKLPQNLNQIMEKASNGKFADASEEEKIKLIGEYIEKDGKTDEEVNKKFETVLKTSLNEEEDQKRVIHSIRHLDRRHQLNSVRTAINTGNDKQRALAQEIVAFDVPKYDATVQIDTTKLIINTKNIPAIEILSKKVSEFNATMKNGSSNQIEAVKLLQNANLEEAAQKSVDKNIINQYAKCAKESQVPIHRIMSGSKYSETVEYAASNIWHFDRDNQLQAVKITNQTGNEKAINAAALQYSKYDNSVKASIADEIKSTGCEVAAKTLQNEIKNDVSYNNEIKNEKNNDKNDDRSETRESIQDFLDSKPSSAELATKISTLDNYELLQLLECSPDASIISLILGSNPSIDVLSKIDASLIKQTNTSLMNTNICFLNSSAQKALVEENASKGTLNQIDRSMLLSTVKDFYDKMKTKEDKKFRS